MTARSQLLTALQTQGLTEDVAGLQVSVMHAFIDEGDYSNMTIDKALRMMLTDFKLPGKLVYRPVKEVIVWTSFACRIG